MKRYIFILFCLMLLSGCQLFEELITDDTPVSKIVQIKEGVEEVHLQNDMDLELVQSTDSVLEIYSQEGLINKIEVTNEDNILLVDYKKFGSWMYDKPRLVIKIPVVPYVKCFRYNHISATDTIRQNSFRIFSDGTGDVNLKLNCQSVNVCASSISIFNLSGKTKKLYGSFTYSGVLSAAKLEADSVFLTHKGSNDLIVSPLKLLKCNILESGDIYYVQHPQQIEISYGDHGRGKVIYDPSKL